MKKMRRFRHENKELLAAGIIFFISFIVFNIIIISTEKVDIISSFYFSFVTATTVGYGDISPQTTLGRAVTVLFMLISIGTLGTTIGVVTSKATDFFSKKKRGMIKVKDILDLIIIGYPNETKVKQIVQEFRKDQRFSTASIVVVTDKLEEIPTWMATEDVYFVKGMASKRETLELANITSAKRVLILAENPQDELSDEYSSSAVIMSERLNPDAYTVAEKVREDKYLFEVAECDLVVSVSRAGELVQEMQDPGAIEFSECIFSNTNSGNQYNVILNKEYSWKQTALVFLENNCTAIGYKIKGEENFCFTPRAKDNLPLGTVVKYIASTPIDDSAL